MAELANYTHKWRAVPDGQQNGTSKVQKRNRQPISCLPCRTRKLKCDRGHPCEGCKKRHEEISCTYGKNAPSPAPRNDISGRNKAQDRLRHLEQLVLHMIESSDDVPGTSQQPLIEESLDQSEPSRSDGRLRIDSERSRYLGSTHWSAILDNIQELKSAIGTSEDADDLEPDTLFSTVGAPSLGYILQESLPSRIQVDRYLSNYFNASYSIVPIIHTFQFKRQYERFWLEPLNTSPVWISILFSIMCISAQLGAVTGSQPPLLDGQPEPKDRFLTASAQCLIVGGYTRPQKHIVEALMLFAQCKYGSTMDPSREVGIVFSIASRLAYRMGYHRNPDKYSQFTPFEREMRCRIWAMCTQFDRMLSFQLGLPNTIPLDSYDTRAPLNLLDSDFDEHTISLPLPRPESEATTILYFTVKSRMMVVFGKACSHALSFNPTSKSEIMALDKEILDIYETVPPILRVRSMSESFADPGYIIMCRLNCECLFRKSLIVLHRNHMNHGNEYSRKSCIDASTRIIKHLTDLHNEFQPGGQLYNDRWMLSSFTMNDFFLAAMALCLAVSIGKRQSRNPTTYFEDDPDAKQQLETLRQAHAVCLARLSTSKECKHVAEALGIVLPRLEPNGPTRYFHGDHLSTNDSSTFNPSAVLEQSHINLTPLSLSEFQNPLTPFADISSFDMELGPLETILGGTQELDWTLLDQYLANPSAFGDCNDQTQSWASTPLRFLGGDPTSRHLGNAASNESYGDS